MAEDNAELCRESRPHRRAFLGGLALGASGGVLLNPAALRADDDKDKDNDKNDEPEKKRDEPPAPPTEAEARMALIESRFGKQLDDKARKAVRAEIDSIVRRAEGLRKFPLDNGDGPFPVFTPYRAPLA